MEDSEELNADQQVAVLADLYSQRAQAYDVFWSPVIRPVGERLLKLLRLPNAEDVLDVGSGAGALLPAIREVAPGATVLGVDRSSGMLGLAREKHAGPLSLMDVQQLALRPNRFDVACIAFVLFHLPSPERCLVEVNRVLKPGGMVGTLTWSVEYPPPVNAIWDEELRAAGARAIELPATDNRSCCDSPDKMTALLSQAGFGAITSWTESLEHRWRASDHFKYQLRSTSRVRLQSLLVRDRETCLGRVRHRLDGVGEDQYTFRGDVVMALASKPG